MATLRIITTALLLTACDASSGAENELEVRIYGEEYIEQGIPADVFDDGWTVQYNRFLITVGSVAVAEAGAGPALTVPETQVFDLTRPSDGKGQSVAVDMVAAGRYDDTSFAVAPDSKLVAGNASADDVKLMHDGNFSVYVAGSATKDGVTRTFAWGFATGTNYSACESLAEVSAAAPATVQLTIHGDHLFYDDLYSETPQLLFGLVASADKDNDGEVTRAELEAVDLRPLDNYQVGSTDIVDLWHFIEHQTTTLGHIDGEGHCKNTREF